MRRLLIITVWLFCTMTTFSQEVMQFPAIANDVYKWDAEKEAFDFVNTVSKGNDFTLCTTPKGESLLVHKCGSEELVYFLACTGRVVTDVSYNAKDVNQNEYVVRFKGDKIIIVDLNLGHRFVYR